MKIAVPSQDDMVCPHFGHCEYFTIAEVNDGEVVSKKPSMHLPMSLVYCPVCWQVKELML